MRKTCFSKKLTAFVLAAMMTVPSAAAAGNVYAAEDTAVTEEYTESTEENTETTEENKETVEDTSEGETQEEATQDYPDASQNDDNVLNYDDSVLNYDEEYIELGDPVEGDVDRAEEDLAYSDELYAEDMAVRTFSTSGILTNSRPTKEQYYELYKQVASYNPTRCFATEPSVKNPYSLGVLDDTFLNSGIYYLNYYRAAAGLDQVRLDSSLMYGDNGAQYGAVLLAATNVLTHTPNRPADMDQNFYQNGYNATSSSNISKRKGYVQVYSLQQSITGCMTDNNSTNNLNTMGHRRWFLNPYLGRIGFGYAISSDNSSFIDTKVFDDSNNAGDYDFISWPSSGTFPNNIITTATPWSVTLNPSKFNTNSSILNNVTVTVTRKSDGKTWTLNKSDEISSPMQSDMKGEYFKVNTQGYGISNCIIFNLGSESIQQCGMGGIYNVKITGLKLKTGGDAVVDYNVDFVCIGSEFAPRAENENHIWGSPVEVTRATCTTGGVNRYFCKACMAHKDVNTSKLGHDYVTTKGTAPTCTKTGTTDLIKCSRCNDVKQASTVIPALGHKDVMQKKLIEATADNMGKAEFKCSVCGEVRVKETWPFLDIPDVNSGSYWAREPVFFVFERGIIVGKSGTPDEQNVVFAPNDNLTRGEFVVMLHRMNGSPAPTGSCPFKDVEKGKFFYNAVVWAYNNHIVNGLSADTFDPYGKITREQLAGMLKNYSVFKKHELDHFSGLKMFPDYEQVDAWAEFSVEWAVGNGIISGQNKIENGQKIQYLAPRAYATRAECAAMLERYINRFGQ